VKHKPIALMHIEPVQQEPVTSEMIVVSAPYVVWRSLPEGKAGKLYKWWAATSTEGMTLAAAHREAHVRFNGLFHYPPKYVLRLGLLFLAGPIVEEKP